MKEPNVSSQSRQRDENPLRQCLEKSLEAIGRIAQVPRRRQPKMIPNLVVSYSESYQ